MEEKTKIRIEEESKRSRMMMNVFFGNDRIETGMSLGEKRRRRRRRWGRRRINSHTECHISKRKRRSRKKRSRLALSIGRK